MQVLSSRSHLVILSKFCHPEQSEGSHASDDAMLRCTQHDMRMLSILCAPLAYSCESVEIIVRPRAHNNLHTLTTLARVRASPGEEEPCDKPYPFGSYYFTLYKIMLRCIGKKIRTGFLREGSYLKTEKKWKLHQEDDAGANQCHQCNLTIQEVR